MSAAVILSAVAGYELVSAVGQSAHLTDDELEPLVVMAAEDVATAGADVEFVATAAMAQMS